MKLYNISLGNLRRRKSKIAFLVLGLMTGVATVVTLMAITRTMAQGMEERLNRFGANIVMVPKSDTLPLSYGGIQLGDVRYDTREFDQKHLADIHTIKNSRNLGIVAPKVLGTISAAGPSGEIRLVLIGVIFEEETALKTWWHLKGSLPQETDELLVGASAARQLGVSPGDRLDLDGRNLPVSAVLEPTGGAEDHVIMTALKTAQALLGKPGKISMVEIAAFCRGCPISEMTLQIAEKFPQAKVTAMKQAVMAKMQSMEMFRHFSYGTSLAVLMIGGLFMMVTMMGSVNERTREIGIFRALGFRQSHVMQIILLEALVMGVLAGAGGFFSGSLLAWGLIPVIIPGSAYTGPDPSLAAIAFVMATVLSLLAAIYPARKAGRMDPSRALRSL